MRHDEKIQVQNIVEYTICGARSAYTCFSLAIRYVFQNKDKGPYQKRWFVLIQPPCHINRLHIQGD